MIGRLTLMVGGFLPFALFGWRGWIFAAVVVVTGYTLAGILEGTWRGLRDALAYHRSVQRRR